MAQNTSTGNCNILALLQYFYSYGTPATMANKITYTSVLLTPEQKSAMEAAAKARGLGLSTWLRTLALAALDEMKKERSGD